MIRHAHSPFGSWLACDSSIPAPADLSVTPQSNCGSWLACDSSIPAPADPSATPPTQCGSWLACDSGIPDPADPSVTPPSKCGSGLARESGLIGDQDLEAYRVHIHSCGNGHLGFRSYSGSLLANAPKVTKRSLPHHSVPRLGSACPQSDPSPRVAAMGHPWPSAAKPASLPVYPLHNTCVRPSWLTGRPRSRTGPRRPESRPGT